jgi:uncharacterized protein
MRRLLRIGTAFAALAGAFAANAAPVHHRAGIDSVATIMRLAEAGNASYQAELGYMYEIGVGVPQDYHLAAAWYYRAAEQGNVIAQQLLGLAYDKGHGVAIDHIEAHKWLNLAASRAGNANRDYFTRLRNAVASKLTRGEIYEAQRRAREWYPLPDY